MMKQGLSFAAALLATTALTTAALSSAALANNPNIGTVSALNQDVDGTPPASETRQLVIGDDLFSSELIESSPIGSGQFLFLDQTSLTIAKNSSLVLDKYVYDPTTKTGEFALSMSQGVLRFVGGRITKNTEAVITTPTATIGIRGGMAIIIVDEDGTTRVMHIAGEYTRVTRIGDDPNGLAGSGGGSGEVFITRGNGVAEANAGGVTYVGVADQRLVRETTLALIGRGEAGEKLDPEDPDVAQSGIPEANSQAKGREKEPPISTTGERSNSGLFEDNEEDRRFRPNDEEVATFIAIDALPDLIEPEAPVETTTLLDGVTGSASFSGSSVPGVTSGPGGETFIFTQVFDGSRIGITAEGETFIIPTENGFFSFNFNEGASPNGAIAGGGFFDDSPEFTYAVFQTRAGDTGAFIAGRASDPLAAAPSGARTTRSYTISPDLFTQNGAAFTPGALSAFSRAGQSDLTLISNEGGGATGGNAKAVATYLEINGTGASQTSGFAVLTSEVTDSGSGGPVIDGFFEGSFSDASGETQRVETRVVSVQDGDGGSAFGEGAQYIALGNGDGVSGDATPGRIIGEDGAETLFGSNNVADRNATANVSSTPAQSGMRGFVAITGRDLATGESYAARSTGTNGINLSVDTSTNSANATIEIDETFANLTPQGAVVRPDVNQIVVSYGGQDDRSAAIDDRNFAMRQAAAGDFSINGFDGESREGEQTGQSVFRGALASSDLAGDGDIFPAGVTARSEFLTWGWWGGEFRGDENASIDTGDGIFDSPDDQRLHLGAWVAGNVATELPFIGIGTYEGFAVVSAIQDGQSVVDGAGFDLTFDFGNRVGTANFTDLLGADATVGVNGQSGVNFDGTAGININGSAGLISVNGTFFDAMAPNAAPNAVTTNITQGRNDAPAATGGSLTVGTFDGRVSGAGIFAGDQTSFEPGN